MAWIVENSPGNKENSAAALCSDKEREARASAGPELLWGVPKGGGVVGE